MRSPGARPAYDAVLIFIDVHRAAHGVDPICGVLETVLSLYDTSYNTSKSFRGTWTSPALVDTNIPPVTIRGGGVKMAKIVKPSVGTRRTFSAEFKQEAVRRMAESVARRA